MPDEQIQGIPPADGAAPAATPADQTATPAPDGEKTPEQLAAEKTAADEAEEKRKSEEEAEELAARKKPWFQRRIDEITLARREAERRAERLEQMLQQAIARTGASDAEQQAVAPKIPEFTTTRPAPTMEGCEFDQEKYMAAMVDWKLEQRESKQLYDRQVAEMQTTQQTVLRSLEEGRVKTIEDGRAKYPDFEPVVFSMPSNVMNPAMLAAVLQTGAPADICYHLGKNPTEAEALAKLPPLKMAVALGNLEARMAATAKRTSQAPPPPNPVSGGRTPAGLKEDDLPYDEWLKRRQAGQIDGRA